MKAIGGYPELELRKGEHYHKDALRLNTARNCFEYILLTRKYRKVYVPYYICEAVYEPVKKLQSQCEMALYNIDQQLEPMGLPDLKEGEAFLYTNYFGLKQDIVEKLAGKFGDRLIIDNSQAFYDMPVEGIDTFYSARKFFGVADGAYLYTDIRMGNHSGGDFDLDRSFDRIEALVKRIDVSPEAGYMDFQNVEESLGNQPIRQMSRLTERILRSIDYEWIRNIRRDNYITLSEGLKSMNKFFLALNDKSVPLCYPFLAESDELRKKLIGNRIYIPTYWPNVLEECSSSSIEHLYSSRLLPLPIDQRYGEDEMKTIISTIS